MIRTAIHAAVWSTNPEPAELWQTLSSAAKIGFDCVAFPLRNFDMLKPAKVAAAFQKAGLGAIGTAGLPANADIGAPDAAERQRGFEHLERVIAVARDCGMSQINGVLYGPLGHSAGPVDNAAMRRSADMMNRIAEVAQNAGILLCLEVVNRYETAMLNTVDRALSYLEAADHPNLRLHLDTFHMAIEEADPVTALRKALPKLGYFELDQSHRGGFDQGSLDLAKMSSPLPEAGYDGLIGVEAFTRKGLTHDHANALAIWRDHFNDPDALARNALSVIRKIFEGASADADRTYIST